MADSARIDGASSHGRLLMFAVMLVIVCCCIELIAFTAIRLLKPYGAFYDPSTVTQNYARYLEVRDAKLGWGPSRAKIAADGTRIDPAFSATSQPCISLFGDSFTWSEEVDDSAAWAALLGSSIKCRVANYGVGGYGTDQAYLRFLSLPPVGEVVFLNHLSENILRNVNQYRNLLYPGPEFNFKPRFVYKNGAIELVPMPHVAPNDIKDFLANPARYLRNEYFLPGGPSGIQRNAFPYSLELLKAILGNYSLHAWSRPSYAEFYHPDHAAQGLQVTFGILSSFIKDANARGQIPIVTLIPTCRDLKYKNAHGAFPYDQLAKIIAAQNVRYIDFGVEIERRTWGEPPEKLYHTCSGHFNAAGYRQLADIAHDFLKNDAQIGQRLGAFPRSAPQIDRVRCSEAGSTGVSC
jgi:hypothetical protein